MTLQNKLGIAALAILTLGSCKKELDFGLYNDNLPVYNPELIAPFLATSVGLENIVDTSDFLVTDSSTNLISVYYRLDSVFNQNLDGLVPVQAQPLLSKNLDLAGINPADVITQRSIALSEIATNLDTATRDSLIANDGNTTYFPPIASQGGGAYPVPQQTQFNYVNLNNASLKLVLSNTLPVELTNMSFEIQNVSDSSVITVLALPTLAAGASDSVTVNLTNATLEKDLQVVISNLESPGSGPDPSVMANWVPINLADQIDVNITLSNIDLNDGEVIIPAQNLPVESQGILLAFGNGIDAELAEVDNGFFSYTVDRNLDAPINLAINLPGVLDAQNNPFSTVISVPPGSTPYSDQLDLAGLTLDLTQSSAAPYNALDVSYQVQIPGTSVPVYINTSDQVSMEYQLTDLEFGYREGYFGTQDVDLLGFGAPVSNDFLERIEGSIFLNDPKFSLLFQNSLGIPIGLNLSLTGSNDEGDSATVDVVDFQLGAPTISQVGDVIASTLLIDKVNYPSIVDLLALLPDQIDGNVGVSLNSAGPNYDNFITSEGRLGLGIEIEIPLDFSATDFVLREAATFNTGLPENNDSIQLESASLFFNIENYFPLDAALDLILKDNAGTTLDTINVTVLQAATPGPDGKVNTPFIYKQEINFDGEQLDNILNAATAQVDVRMSTVDNGANPVKIFVDYTIDVKVAAQVKAAIIL